MLSLLWLAALSPLAHAECDDVATLVDSAEQAVIEARTDDAGATLRQAEAALGCSPVPSAALLARMWLAEGTRAYMQGDEKVARLAFAAAARVAPEVWVESYGPQVRQIYKTAAEHDGGTGSVRIHPNPEGWSTTLDGEAVSFPFDAASGLHMVQVGRSAERTEYSEVFYLPRDETYFILTGLEDTPIVSMASADPEPPVVTEPEPPVVTEPAVVDVEPPVVPDPAQTGPTPLEAQPLPDPTGDGFSSPVFLVLGSATAAVAGGAAIAALMQDPNMETAVNIESLDRTYARQKTLAYTSYGLAGVAVASFGVHFAMKF